MSLCVNINSKEFKDTAKRLDISEASLENIVHEYMNTEGNEVSFPSDSYILSKTEGQPFTEPLSEKAQKLIDKKYSKPITVDSYADAQAVMNDMAQYFDPQHIGLKETLSGKYQVSLGNTETAREMFTIKSEAEKNGTFMKAPNGEPTNLNERQWLQVRTKEFKDWFGDWENNPSEASKVVDENGEPKVMYHATPWGKFNVFKQFQPNTGDRTKPGELYFSNSRQAVSRYKRGDFNRGNNSPEVYEVFLNIRNPYKNSEPINKEQLDDILNDLKSYLSTEEFNSIQQKAYEGFELNKRTGTPNQAYHVYTILADYFKNHNQERFYDVVRKLINSGHHDGMFFLTKEEFEGQPINFREDARKQVWVMASNQIKSATENIGTFSRESNNIYYQVKKSESEIIEDANYRRQQRITELESDIERLKSELSSLDRKDFINSAIKRVNLDVEEAQRYLRHRGRLTSSGLHSLVEEFNKRYQELISSGVIDALSQSIADKISVFNDDGRVYYDTSKIRVKRDIQAIKAKAGEQLQNEISNLQTLLERTTTELEQVNKSTLNDYINELYYQKDINPEDIQTIQAKLKPINKKFGSMGSEAKIAEFLKKLDLPVEIRSALMEGYKSMPSTLKNMTPYEALQYLANVQYKGLIAQYNESIRKPQNEQLEKLLTDYLEQYGFEINIGDAVKSFGDVTGVLDIINKIIYVANNRNETTLPEEFGHAFVELLGSVVSKREENRDFTFLMNTVENTELYKQVFENYKDVYKREDGTPDTYKIKKEAIGQGVGLAILSQYNGQSESTKTFFQKLVELIEKILNKFKGSEYLSFETLVNKMAQEVLDGSTKRLNKVNQDGYNLLEYNKTIEEQNKKDGGKALSFMKYFTSIGNQITGSLAYRLQGTVYRPGLDSLHDIDMHVPPSAHGIDFNSGLLRNAIQAAMARNQEELLSILTSNPYFTQIKEKYPKIKFGAAYPDNKGRNRITVNAVYSEDTSLADRFLKMSGSYADRLKNFTEEERAQIYLFDFFLVDHENAGLFEPIYGLQLSTFDTPIREKRWMGRAKDIMDYQNWRIFDEFKNKVLPKEEDLMYQITPSSKTHPVEPKATKEQSVDAEGLSIPTEEVRPELTEFQDRTTKMVTQLNNLLDSGLVTKSEVRHIAEQAVYFISDSITEFMENPSKIFDTFANTLGIREGRPITEEEKNSEIEKIKEMSRAELASYITPEQLINLAKNRLFTSAGNSAINTRALGKKANLIFNNFVGVLRFAEDAFNTVEKFSITYEGERLGVKENTNTELKPEENYDTEEEVNTDDTLENWQIENRTQDIMSSMSDLVRQALNKCFQIRVNPETGAKEKIPSEFGIAERINAKDATASILRWTRGAESLSHMLQMLEAKAKENPWIEQVTERLKDQTGKEADFQSQFYGVFAKAFQPYSIVLKERNEKTGAVEYKSIQVNQHPALTDATQSVEVAFKTNTHPMFDTGKIKKDVLDTYRAIVDDLVNRAKSPLEENNIGELVDLISKASAALGYTVDLSTVYLALDSSETFNKMVNNLKAIGDKLTKALGQENYNPFKFGGENSISGYLKSFLQPLTDKLEDTAVSSFYDSGKMYQSYVTPSYLTVLMTHLTSDDARFQQYIQSEYGAYGWFKTPNGEWRNKWLEILDGMSQEDRKNLLKHKVQLNFNKHNYMKNMSDVEYALSIFSEYFSEYANAKGTTVPVWYRIPMMSNKPSSEFIRMYAYTGKLMEGRLAEEFSKIFQQELSRIQAVDIRAYDKSNPNFIKNFDKNGKKFMMLDFFNKYLKGNASANSELGGFINRAIEKGTESFSAEENNRFAQLVNQEIITSMNAKADTIIAEWKASGVFEGAKQIANIGTDDATVEAKLREFIWNDTFASMNILELTITDPAFYKDAEDLQKRLAQIHAPGIRANVEAIDYEGNRVSSDGKFRTMLLKDFDYFISNIKDNLRIVFDRKLEELKKTGLTEDSADYKAAVAIYNNIIDQFNNINVADAQGYSSPTSYRKKAFIFGRWSRSAEDIYKKLLNNEYTYTDLQTAFQPLKPFVYGQIEKPGIESARSDVPTPLSTLKVPVQFKNSEYLLIMADAILQNEDTGKPNLLRAIYQVMEDSAYDGRERDASGRVTKQGVYNGRGIDTIQFESTCKSGLQGAIDINQYYDVENGETLAKQALEEAIEKEYVSRVYEVPFENYAIQQEVPEHFKNHFQAHGSQIRYIIPSDLETVDSEGNPVTYDYFDRGEQKKLSAGDFKAEYENNIAENIQESLNTLRADLGIDNAFLSKKDRNIALSKVLLEEILSSPRYGVELAVACTVNSETGEFNIPLGDPIQSKRIEQLINSVIKNRINKQEIAGGPVVQVSNFGTSRQLNIVFKDKRGGLLMTRAEFEKSGREGTFEDYIRENQAGISHYEVFAPIYANELFNKFADKEGNIDIETIEKINPDLLKMIGYRIPTEDKYSMAPLKIVGFLPREAGDGIMLPNDITLLTGSDFDIDKFYLMRKEINITHRFLGDVSNIAEDSPFYEKNKTSIRKELLKRLEYTYEKIKLSDAAKGRVEERAALLEEEAIKSLKEKKEQKHNTYMLRAEALERNKNERLEPIRKAYDRDVDALEASFKNNEITEEEYNSRMDELDDAFTKDTERIESKYQRSLDRLGEEPSTELTEWERAEISEEKQTNMYELARAAQRRLLRDAIDSFLDNPFAKPKDALERKIKDAYIKYMFDFAEPTEGTTYRNNKIVDMSWAVLTNETTASKMLTPGGFEPEKRMGYLVSAYQNPAVNMTWEQLNAIDNIDDLKALCYTDKNLCFIDTHLQFYKQNSAAATALGMAAVQKVAHAVLEGDGFMLDVSKALDFADDEYFTIAGKKFIGRMELDRKFNDNGELIGRTLGEFVAMFADAVKDPVANLMNINNTTMPMVTTLIRLGLPFKQVALFVSQPVIKEVLDLYNSKNITTFTRLSDVIQERIDKIVKDYSLEEESRINEFNEVTEEELIENLNPEVRADAAEESAVADYKILRFFQYITKLSSAIKGTTYATRLNSISSAVGPLIIDNLIMEYKMNQSDFSNIFDETGTEVSFGSILQRHPILSRFSEALDIATDLFSEMPINSQNFRDMVFSADVADDLKSIIFGDRKILNELSDFYKSYLLIASNTVPVNATAENKYQGIKYYVEQFPQDFMRGKAKERYKGNSLIDAIRVDVQRGRTVLKIDTTGMTTQDKEKLGDGWEDLYFRTDEGGRKLAEHLFYYNFWRAGIGFSPKSFMGLFPTRLKSQIAGYNEAFTVHSLNYASNVVGKDVVEQFIRNNADNNKLVPRTSIGKNGASLVKTEDGKTLFVFRGENYEKIKNNPYLKVKQGNNIVILKRELTNREGKEATYTTLELLGNNGEYFEAYTGTEYTPLTTTETTTEASKESQLQEVSGITEDVPEQTQPTDREKFKRATYIKDQLLQAFKLKGLSEEASKQKVEGFDKKSAEERAKLASSVEEFVGKVFEEHNIPFDKDEFEEAYKEFC